MLTLALSLRATAVVRPEEADATGILVNAGPGSVEVDLVQLTSPSLALEVVDDKGRPVHMPPPPTPGRPDVVVLPPGERRLVEFRAFLPAGTPPGRYGVRLRCGHAVSAWIGLDVGG